MTRPNFFLIGHPRSGTGTLDGYLLSHPDIFMAAKELHYFGSDLHFNNPPRKRENYLAYFRKASHKCIGESSTWYLASRTAAKEIKQFEPEAKIILSLRNPVDWLYSLHSHMVFAGYEDTLVFQDALNKEEDRLRGYQMPPNAYPPIGVRYRSLVRYHDQVQRYFSEFGRKNVHIILFDDLKSQPQTVLEDALSFLGLPTEYEGKSRALQSSKKQRNANHAHRSRTLHHWIKSGKRRAILHGVTKAPLPGPRFVLRLLHKLNTKTTERTMMNAQLRTQLTQELRAEVEKIESLINVNLSSWKGKDSNIP
ncbi:MAG: sulfotransferase [Myxococcota bacterium]|nr:sulfotransferase [Myxococcota bacterium]